MQLQALALKPACRVKFTCKLLCAAAWYVRAAEAGPTENTDAERNITCQDLARTALQYMAFAVASCVHAMDELNGLAKTCEANKLDQGAALLRLQHDLDASLDLLSTFMSKFRP